LWTTTLLNGYALEFEISAFFDWSDLIL
jgi:hypothetical protein